jgi:CRP/FNR family cyclic AMP-dependent transcriptional regulator
MNPDSLRKIPLFESLETNEAAELCRLLEVREAPGDATIFRAGEAGDAMYIIEQGRVRISMQAADGHELTLTELREGEFFGEMALLDGKPRSANATTLETSRLAVLSRPHLLSFIDINPNVALEMLTALARRLRRTDELLRHRATRNVNEEEAAHLTLADRLADVIAEFGGSWKFIIFSLVLFVIWIVANSILLSRRPFDPFPFILLNLALNMITALQAPIIMMSQNRQSHKDRLRADLDYQVNLKNELMLGEILQRLDVVERDVLESGATQDRQQK